MNNKYIKIGVGISWMVSYSLDQIINKDYNLKNVGLYIVLILISSCFLDILLGVSGYFFGYSDDFCLLGFAFFSKVRQFCSSRKDNFKRKFTFRYILTSFLIVSASCIARWYLINHGHALFADVPVILACTIT